jgi:hypothetical protein
MLSHFDSYCLKLKSKDFNDYSSLNFGFILILMYRSFGRHFCCLYICHLVCECFRQTVSSYFPQHRKNTTYVSFRDKIRNGWRWYGLWVLVKLKASKHSHYKGPKLGGSCWRPSSTLFYWEVQVSSNFDMAQCLAVVGNPVPPCSVGRCWSIWIFSGPNTWLLLEIQ